MKIRKIGKLKLSIQQKDILAFFGALYLFLTMQPFFIWSLKVVSLIYIIPFLVMIYPVALESRFRFSYNHAIIFTTLLIYITYIALPLFGKELLLGKYLLFAPFLLLLFVSSASIEGIFTIWRKILIFFVIYALIIYLLFALKVDIPYWVLENRDKIPITSRAEHFFRAYGLVVSSTNTLWRIGGVLTMRLCGPFAEPGHLGIYIGFTMLIDRFMRKKNNWILLTGGLLTLSPAFLLILIIIELHRIINDKRINWKLFIIILFGFTVLSIIKGPEIKDRLLYITIERHSDLNKRSPIVVRQRFADFLKTSKVITGVGKEEFQEFGGSLSDPRGIIAKFGLIGLVLSLFIIFLFLAEVDKKHKLFLLTAVLLVYSHRVWMFESVYIYMFMLIASAVSKKELIKENDDITKTELP